MKRNRSYKHASARIFGFFQIPAGGFCNLHKAHHPRLIVPLKENPDAGFAVRINRPLRGNFRGDIKV
jgi:hypothetical protein